MADTQKPTSQAAAQTAQAAQGAQADGNPSGKEVAPARGSKPACHGWIVLDKPLGLGSTQAVAAVKRNLREGGYAKAKVGHGGTLDPLAQGVLPIALGEATKLAGRMLDASKIYAFTIQFGEATDTLDSEGEVAARSNHRPSIAAIGGVLEQFIGEIEQIPPAYSAIKIDGKRAYARARAGESVEPKPRRVRIHRLGFASDALASDGLVDDAVTHDGLASDRLASDGLADDALAHDGLASDRLTDDVLTDDALVEQVTLIAHVSKGTYIRSLARDIARSLGTLGHVTYLRRIKAGPFHQSQSISLDKLNKIGKGAPLEDVILPIEAGLDDIPALSLSPEQAEAARSGRVLNGQPQADGLYFAKYGTLPVALMELSSGTAKVVRGFNFPDVAE